MEAEKSQYLFIYSSLRKGFHQSGFDYIARYFNFICNAQVKGVLNTIVRCAVATPTNEDHFISGELYQLKEKNDFSWVFGQLDDYEGITPEPGEEPLYRRELTSVIMDDKTITAWIYWYNGDTSGRPEITSGDLFQYLQEKK